MKPIDLTEAAERYVAEHELSPRSRRCLLAIPKRLSEHLGMPATTADLDPVTVRIWLQERAEIVGELAVRTDAKRCVTLWRWCASQGWADPPWLNSTELCPKELRRYRREDAENPTAPPKGIRPPQFEGPAGNGGGGRYRFLGKAPPRPDRGLLGRIMRG
ncbi:hypothetical protein [Botrimarina sp.]|uniref:hypothetical protein n=1 Tax=Botrimarina sp. TaxID=2795802 RepID=UPI0032F095D5